MTLEEIVKRYYEFRGYEVPDAGQALLFLVSEVGELADAHVHSQALWVRNNERERSVPDEVGDVMMMLVMYCAAQGLDPAGVMLDKMRARGFEISLGASMGLLK